MLAAPEQHGRSLRPRRQWVLAFPRGPRMHPRTCLRLTYCPIFGRLVRQPEAQTRRWARRQCSRLPSWSGLRVSASALGTWLPEAATGHRPPPVVPSKWPRPPPLGRARHLVGGSAQRALAVCPVLRLIVISRPRAAPTETAFSGAESYAMAAPGGLTSQQCRILALKARVRSWPGPVRLGGRTPE